MHFERSKSFDQDLKALRKRFRSLDQDLETLMKILAVRPEPPTSLSVEISGYGTSTRFVKVRKFACRSLPGRGSQSGLRLIYALEPGAMVFLELYFKSDQERESQDRILDYINQRASEFP
jgi:hypothetical protein